ncbi:hypothetical protein NA57DRAFT_82230 [Rhizodiscina lignyota]|uniref:Zn(2)-C6 fungal-type domain-containing protein n=1 Tax=Rhizodiscina lignyota TaxID=1504668 RepID=A0A9P4M452_9PEZI|nr:hypothetical protein NA57DRAFT_82230 [Rhizodiscina lignyota]
MVNHGPAKGCQMCKERHIKCDLGRPACRQCVRLNYVCPGYRHELDMVLRDETATLIGRYRNQKRGAAVSHVAGMTVQPPSLPKDIALAFESRALHFMLSGAAWEATDWRTSHGHLDFVQPLYRGAAFDSPLALAATWLAVLIMGTCYSGTPYSSERLLLSKVFKSILAAVADPVHSVKDETLAAVILVTYGEHGSTSLALFDAVRHNVVNLANSGIRKARNWDLWNLRPDLRQPCDSYTPATELDAFGVTVVDLRLRVQEEIRCFDVRLTLREELLTLLERLGAWQYRIPSEWLPRQRARGTLKYPSPEVDYLFAQWHILQLQVNHLMKPLDIETGDVNFSNQCYWWEMKWINDIIASEDSFLNPGWNKRNLVEPEQSAHVDGDLPRAKAQQWHSSPHGSRLFGQALDKLDLILSNALNDLGLPDDVASHYREVLSWTRRERETIKQAFPWGEI